MSQQFNPAAVPINYTLNFEQVNLILEGLAELPVACPATRAEIDAQAAAHGHLLARAQRDGLDQRVQQAVQHRFGVGRRLLRLFIELNRLGTSVVIATHDIALMNQFDSRRLAKLGGARQRQRHAEFAAERERARALHGRDDVRLHGGVLRVDKLLVDMGYKSGIVANVKKTDTGGPMVRGQFKCR